MEEPTPICSLCSFFTNKYNRLQNQDNLPSSSGLQLSPRFQAKIGLFISFLALAASFEVLLASSIGKSAFPNSSGRVNEFLTNPLSSSHQHFTGGTVLGTIAFVVSLMALIYFVKKIYVENAREVDHVLACRPKNAFSLFRPSVKTVQNLYRDEGINSKYWTYAGVPDDSGGSLYLGIPFEQYKNISWEAALERELQIHAAKYKTFHHFTIVPITLCQNLSQYSQHTSNSV